MKLVFYKSKEFPIGHISTNAQGQKMKKVGVGKWIPVSGGSSQANKKTSSSGKSIPGLAFKDGFYFDGKTKISNSYEKAKQYVDKKQGQKSSGNPAESIKVGDTIRVKSNASRGGIRETKARGMIAKVQSIVGDVVRIVDDAGKAFQVNKMALEFAKSGVFVNSYDLIKSEAGKKSKSLIFNLVKARPTKYIKRIPKSGGGYRYIYKEAPKEKSNSYKVSDEVKKKSFELGKNHAHAKYVESHHFYDKKFDDFFQEEESKIKKNTKNFDEEKMFRLGEKLGDIWKKGLNQETEKIKKETDIEKLHFIAEMITELDFKLQDAWGFERDARFHTWWYRAPKCTCGTMDNRDALGSGYEHINANCPLHGFYD